MKTTQRLVVVPGEQIGTINPNLHGHFSEHLGECVYPGISVPLDSDIPNTNGLRHDVVEALKPLEIPNLRWPGGCFADDYHWRDGIGPVEKRPLRLNRHWGWTQENGQFGTHEFMEFCRLLGAEPYFAGNVGSGTPAELSDWIEYCNYAGDSTLANERRANGAEEPFGIKFWGIGNENWWCGGMMSPEQYAGEFCRFRNYVANHSGTKIEAIACGQDNADWNWTRRFLTFVRSSYASRLHTIGGYGVHFYCGTAGTALNYTDQQFVELAARAAAIEGVLTGARSIMDEFDPQRKINLIIDEWGAWHPVEEGKPGYGLYQQNTVRDAVVAAISLDAFHRHADKIQMANIAQLINVLQSVLLVEGDKVIKTPTYHVFDLYRPHKGATAVRLHNLSEVISHGEGSEEWCKTRYLNGDGFALRAINGSASIKDGQLCVTASNSHATETVELEVAIEGGAWGELEVVQLAFADIRSHNTFEAPENVTLGAPTTVQAENGVARIAIAPGGVVRLRGAVA